MIGLVAFALCGAAPLLACYEPEVYSAHFSDVRLIYPNRGRPDFFRMPQPWRGFPPEMRALPGAAAHFSESLHDSADRLDPAEWAMRLEAAGRFHEAAAAWARYPSASDQAEAADPEDSQGPPEVQGLEDRLVALQAWRGPQDTAPLRLYLRARDLVNVQDDTDARRLLAGLTQEPYRTHAEYLRACILFYSTGTPEVSASAFQALLKRHPRHQLALYMIGRSYFRSVYFSQPVHRGPGRPDPRDGQIERRLRRALAAYDACAAAAPNTSLADDARGMAGACLFRLGEYPEALLRYCRQLAGLPPGEDDRAAFVSARMCLQRMALADHRVFQARAVTRPELASVYLDLHLYYGQAGARTTYNLGRFALEVLKRHPAAPLSGRLLARLALIEGRLGHWERAERLAATAMARCPAGAYRDQAGWQRAQALRQLRHRQEALAEYEGLATNATVPKMRRGAHEAAAVLSEEIGDRPNAIRHYFALEYRLDYAYLIDCLATQEELRAFLRRFPDHPRAKLVRYSLGFRQLRAGQYDAAARTFASLGPWLDVAEKLCDCATSQGKPRWPPLRTARFLVDAARREAAARTDAEKARAAYSRAQLLFRQRHLVLYNGALWKGWRVYAFEVHSPDTIRSIDPPHTPEERAYLRHQNEHAALYQALRIFERIAREYPRTPEAPKALYSAALCASFLPHLDGYWRRQAGPYFARAMRLYRRLRRDYPNDPLAVAAAKYGGPPPQPGARPGGSARGGGG
jgi:tetratricopeptide (TPR) repeat protein